MNLKHNILCILSYTGRDDPTSAPLKDKISIFETFASTIGRSMIFTQLAVHAVLQRRC